MTRTHRSPRTLLGALLAVLLVFLALPFPTAPVHAEDAPQRYVSGEVLIGWTPGRGPVAAVQPPQDALQPDAAAADWQAATRAVAAETGLPVLEARPDYGTARLKVRPGQEMAEIARLEALPWVSYAEPNYIAYAAGAPAYYPNDPDFSKQWHALRVDAPGAWAMTRGSLSFVVAVLDTGVATGHPEFAGKLLGGRDYINNDYWPEDDDPESHGTHVTGIIAAGFDNAMGVAGLAPDIKILPFKVLDATRIGPYSTISQAIRDAANSQAQVINMSFIGLDYSQTLQNAVSDAIGSGALLVAAAGNCAAGGGDCRNQINPTVYPAAFPGVLAVAASDRYDQITYYSGYKPYVGIAAPGGTAERGVWSTTRWGYGYLSGTSMSAPMVSAAAALVWTLRPAAPPAEIAELLKSTADKVGTYSSTGEPLAYPGGRNDYFGAGRLNIGRAVRQAYPPSLASPGYQDFFLGGSRAMQTREVAIENPSLQGVWWRADQVEGGSWLSISPSSGTSVFGAAGKLSLTANLGALSPGSYFALVKLTPLAPSGVASVNIPIQLQVAAKVSQSFLPVTGQAFGASWYDPDAADSLYRLDLNLTNDSLAQVVLPFPVTYYGASFQVIQVSDNGLVAFGQGNAPMKPPTVCPGNGAAPNNALYAFAADWVPEGDGHLIVHQPNNDTFVVTWRGVRLAGTEARATFQLEMRRSGEFLANYLAVDNPSAGIIGSENEDGTLAEQVLCRGLGRPAPVGGSVALTARAPWQ